MKRFFAVLMLILLPFSVVSCEEPIVINGIDSYTKATCSFGLTSNLFPSEDFPTSFEYEKADYAYYDSGDLIWGYAKAFAFFRYSEEDYQKAKNFCLNTIPLDSKKYEYGGYCFSEYLCYTVKDEDGEWISQSRFPEIFNMVGYNDEECILIFIGYCNGNPDHPDRVTATTDFGNLLTATYSEYFNFD
jgi:hypothetical protein